MALGSKIGTKSSLIHDGVHEGSAPVYLNSTGHSSLQITELEKRNKLLQRPDDCAFKPFSLPYLAFSNVLNTQRFVTEGLKEVSAWER